jgi:hypothetical protein
VVGLNIPDDFLFYLSAHESCSERIFASAKGLTAKDIEISADPEIALVKKMVYSVQMEVHRMKGFVRLQPLGTHVLYGYLRPRHRIGGHICRHLAGRNPGIIVVLGNQRESWISLFIDGKTINNHGGGLAMSLEEIKSALNCSASHPPSSNFISSNCPSSNCPSQDNQENQQDVETIWKTYYASQYCKERRNIKAFHRRMPKGALKSAGSTMEKNNNGVTLDDFCRE